MFFSWTSEALQELGFRGFLSVVCFLFCVIVSPCCSSSRIYWTSLPSTQSSEPLQRVVAEVPHSEFGGFADRNVRVCPRLFVCLHQDVSFIVCLRVCGCWWEAGCGRDWLQYLRRSFQSWLCLSLPLHVSRVGTYFSRVMMLLSVPRGMFDEAMM